MSESDKQTENKRNVKGQFIEGNKESPGRPKGAKDKISKNIKENFDAVFEKLGGVDGFFKWAEKNNQTQSAFYQMYSKMLPSNVTADLLPDIDSELTITIVKTKDKDEDNS